MSKRELPKKIRTWFVDQKLRYLRGKELFAIINDPFQYLVNFSVLFASFKILFGLDLALTGNILKFIVPLILFVFITLGLLDMKYGIWLTENERNIRIYNPFFNKMEKEIGEIKKIVEEIKTYGKNM